jgi:large subunit ribosomal protein L18e
MGVDIKAGGRIKVRKRTDVKCDNPYLKLSVKLYKFLARRTDSKFNKVIANRLCQTRVQKAPMSVSKLASHMENKVGKTAVVAGTITNDIRWLPESFPALKICALKFTEGARKRIEKNGGSCMTFDQLALQAPLGKGCVLLRGQVKARVVNRYFGKAPGVPKSTTRPYVRKASNLKRKGRKHEQARGRRKSRGYKV